MASPRTAPLRTGCTSTFTLKQRRLHIVVVDPRDEPYAGHEYVLTIGRHEYSGRTGPDGAIRHEVSAFPTGALVLVLPPAASVPADAKQTESPLLLGEGQGEGRSAATVPPYPPAIVPEDFEGPSPASSTAPVTLQWDLRIQPLPSFDSDAARAAQERLHNLGFYDVASERGAPGPRTRSAVRAWQRRHGEPDTGRLADIQRELTRRHDVL